jgi:uncharacterized hydrophobic protein (TIGR00271 family)
MNPSIYLVAPKDHPLRNQVDALLSSKHTIVPTHLLPSDSLPKTPALFLLLLSDDAIKQFIKKELLSTHTIAMLPTENNPKATASYGISTSLELALEDALDPERCSSVDTLTCNDEIVFDRVSIGDMHDLYTHSAGFHSLRERVKTFFKNLLRISYDALTFTTASGQKIHTAASGVMVLEHTIKANQYNIDEPLSFQDNLLTALIFAPSSLLAYWYHLLCMLFLTKFSLASLPKSLGLIRTSSLHIESEKPLEFSIDGAALSAQSVCLEVQPKTHKLQLGRKMALPASPKKQEVHDITRVGTIPKSEMGALLASGYVPLFKKAAEEDFKELFTLLRSHGVLSPSYLILMVLSTLLAVTGLFQNSTPVIIGAMILAPLMGPIMTLSMGAVRVDKQLLLKPARTILGGISIAVFSACVYTLIIPLETTTAQMSARLNPNTLDLMVAIFSGIAGAYAQAKSHVAQSLAGVAIAVALVPPLGVTGIGLGWMDWEMVYGAFLLFSTNLIGMIMAGAATFTVLGYAPIKRAKHALTYSAILVGIMSVPLALSFQSLVEENRDYKQLSELSSVSMDAHHTVYLTILSVQPSHSSPTLVEVEVLSNQPLTQSDRQHLKATIEQQLNKQITLHIIEKIEI